MDSMLVCVLGAVVSWALAQPRRDGAADGGKPDLKVIPGGKAPKKKKKTKAKLMPITPAPGNADAIVLQPSADAPGLHEMIRALPPPPDPSTADGQLGSSTPRTETSVSPATSAAKKKPAPKKKAATVPASKRVAAPKKPTPPRAAARPAPTAKALAKSPKRTPKKAAEDLRDYLNANGNPGSKGNRSAYVAQCQTDMGGLAADGVIGPKTRTRAAQLGVSIKPR